MINLFIEALLKAIADRLVEYLLNVIRLWMKRRSLRSLTASMGESISMEILFQIKIDS